MTCVSVYCLLSVHCAYGMCSVTQRTWCMVCVWYVLCVVCARSLGCLSVCGHEGVWSMGCVCECEGVCM